VSSILVVSPVADLLGSVATILWFGSSCLVGAILVARGRGNPRFLALAIPVYLVALWWAIGDDAVARAKMSPAAGLEQFLALTIFLSPVFVIVLLSAGYATGIATLDQTGIGSRKREKTDDPAVGA
jgi:hypothetical protein